MGKLISFLHFSVLVSEELTVRFILKVFSLTDQVSSKTEKKKRKTRCLKYLKICNAVNLHFKKASHQELRVCPTEVLKLLF